MSADSEFSRKGEYIFGILLRYNFQMKANKFVELYIVSSGYSYWIETQQFCYYRLVIFLNDIFKLDAVCHLIIKAMKVGQMTRKLESNRWLVLSFYYSAEV